MFKIFALVCAQAIIQSVSAQFIGAYNGIDIAAGYGWAGAVAPWAASIETIAAPIETIVTPCETVAPIGLYESAWALPFVRGFGPTALAASNGAGLAITSMSPVAPTGVSMTSENVYEGPLAVSGAMHFLGSVFLDGALPTVGAGVVAYGCGNGNVAMLTEEVTPAFEAVEVVPGPYGALVYDGLPYGLPEPYAPLAYEGLNGAYEFPGPYAYEGIGFGPMAYDGIVGPYGYPAYGFAGPWL